MSDQNPNNRTDNMQLDVMIITEIVTYLLSKHTKTTDEFEIASGEILGSVMPKIDAHLKKFRGYGEDHATREEGRIRERFLAILGASAPNRQP